MMSNELSTPESNPFAIAAATMPVVKNDVKIWEETVAAGNWMPSLRQISSRSTKLTSPPASLTAGNFYYMRNSNGVGAQDLGRSVIIVPVASRYKAVEEKTDRAGSKYFNYFDPASEDYKRVRQTAEGPGLTGCFHGPEYLVWVDGAGELGGGWAHFHCSNKTSRNSSADIEKHVGKNKTLKLSFYMAEGGKFQWEAYTVAETVAQLQAYPTMEDLLDRIKKFGDEGKLGVVLEQQNDPNERPQ